MLIFNFWGRMSAENFFLLQFFISLGKPKFDIISFFLGHLILGESCFYSQCGAFFLLFDPVPDRVDTIIFMPHNNGSSLTVLLIKF